MDNDERKEAIQRAIDDGVIDENIEQIIIKAHCPDCEQGARRLDLGMWSHESTASEMATLECWYCGTSKLEIRATRYPWDAPLDRLPPSAIPDEYKDDQ